MGVIVHLGQSRVFGQTCRCMVHFRTFGQKKRDRPSWATTHTRVIASSVALRTMVHKCLNFGLILFWSEAQCFLKHTGGFKMSHILARFRTALAETFLESKVSLISNLTDWGRDLIGSITSSWTSMSMCSLCSLPLFRKISRKRFKRQFSSFRGPLCVRLIMAVLHLF